MLKMVNIDIYALNMSVAEAVSLSLRIMFKL